MTIDARDNECMFRYLGNRSQTQLWNNKQTRRNAWQLLPSNSIHVNIYIFFHTESSYYLCDRLQNVSVWLRLKNLLPTKCFKWNTTLKHNSYGLFLHSWTARSWFVNVLKLQSLAIALIGAVGKRGGFRVFFSFQYYYSCALKRDRFTGAGILCEKLAYGDEMYSIIVQSA